MYYDMQNPQSDPAISNVQPGQASEHLGISNAAWVQLWLLIVVGWQAGVSWKCCLVSALGHTYELRRNRFIERRLKTKQLCWLMTNFLLPFRFIPEIHHLCSLRMCYRIGLQPGCSHRQLQNGSRWKRPYQPDFNEWLHKDEGVRPIKRCTHGGLCSWLCRIKRNR